jgi:hypothetical protein
VVGVVLELTTAGAVPVFGAVVEVVLRVVLVAVEVAVLVVVLVVVVAGAVLVTVLEVVGVDIVVGLFFFFAPDEPPKKVVGWPLPVIERPAMRSGTV